MMKKLIIVSILFLATGCSIPNKNKNVKIEFDENGNIKKITVIIDSSHTQEVSFYENGGVSNFNNYSNHIKDKSQISIGRYGGVYFIEDADTGNGSYYTKQLYVFDRNTQIIPSSSYFVLAEKDTSVGNLKIYYMSKFNEVCQVDSILPNRRAWKCGKSISTSDSTEQFLSPLKMPLSPTGYYHFTSEQINLLTEY